MRRELKRHSRAGGGAVHSINSGLSASQQNSAPHSISLSAVASSSGGVFRLKALAVLRLMTSSNLVGWTWVMVADVAAISNPAMQSVLNDEQERVSGGGKDEQHNRNRDHLFSLQELHRVDDQKT